MRKFLSRISASIRSVHADLRYLRDNLHRVWCKGCIECDPEIRDAHNNHGEAP